MKKMHLLLIGLLVVVMVCVAACGGGNSGTQDSDTGEKVTIVAGHAGYLMEGGLHPYQQGLEKFAELVNEKTNGRITVEIHGSGELGTERELIEGVGLSTVDMTVVTSSPVTGFVNEFNIFEMPYLFKDSQHAYSVLDSEIGQELLDKLSTQNILLLM